MKIGNKYSSYRIYEVITVVIILDTFFYNYIKDVCTVVFQLWISETYRSCTLWKSTYDIMSYLLYRIYTSYEIFVTFQ